ncbi:Rieske 2Fe-2S domain-containing protein [Teredinibacter waterburyi]|uniref:Rieske 2Fe-2S domain-containing protein n=1 Tax=Teredinibacter waterburyi TaxID=1500538 RepID=UPI00165FCC4B|nr:Rieske 2Fe-2S domain-containing protein [Teredinibacter waterburyi]
MGQENIFKYFHPVIEVENIEKNPRSIELGGRKIVVFKSGKGVAALDDNCPHRHTPLSLGTVEGGRIHCPYHGWNFGADGKGSVPLQPKLNCAVNAYTAVEKLGYVWIAEAGTSLDKLPAFISGIENLTDGWEDCIALKPIDLLFNAALPQTIDNFGEIEHVPFVHQVLGWSVEDVPKMHVGVEVGEDFTVSKGWGPQRLPPSRLLQLIDKYIFRCGDTSLLEWDFRFNPCHSTFMPGWGEPNCSVAERRAFSVRATSIFIPENDNTTRLLNFPFIKIHERRLKFLKPLVAYIARKNLYEELVLDKKACEMVSDVPNDLSTMRLGIRDKQLVANRKMLQKIYYGEQNPKTQSKKLIDTITVADDVEVGDAFTV